jgi:hypothetical protein
MKTNNFNFFSNIVSGASKFLNFVSSSPENGYIVLGLFFVSLLFLVVAPKVAIKLFTIIGVIALLVWGLIG